MKHSGVVAAHTVRLWLGVRPGPEA
jgi:hypothetical protein